MHKFAYPNVEYHNMQAMVKAFKTLGDEIRIRILKVLLQRECCVCEIMQALDISQSRASRNLGILEDAGFVKSGREGLWIVYSINEQTMNRYGASLTEMLRRSLADEQVIVLDRERLSHAVRCKPGAMAK